MQKNDTEFLNKIEIKYDDKNLINKIVLKEYIKNNFSFKIKIFSTIDNENIIVNDKILNWLNENKIDIKKLTLNQYEKYDFCKNNYIQVDDLLNDLKNNIDSKNNSFIYIEVLNYSKKNLKELIDAININSIKVIISSKEKKVLKILKKKAPSIIRGLKYKSVYNENLRLNYFEKKKTIKVKVPFGTKPDFIEYDINSLSEKTLEIIKRKNLLLLTSLIDTDAKYKKASMLSNSYVVKNNYLDREEF